MPAGGIDWIGLHRYGGTRLVMRELVWHFIKHISELCQAGSEIAHDESKVRFGLPVDSRQLISRFLLPEAAHSGGAHIRVSEWLVAGRRRILFAVDS